jgi:hypothetical protein
MQYLLLNIITLQYIKLQIVAKTLYNIYRRTLHHVALHNFWTHNHNYNINKLVLIILKYKMLTTSNFLT